MAAEPLTRRGAGQAPGDRRLARILYVLPKPDFFARGRRGRVAHATGVVSGLLAAGTAVVVASGPGVRDHVSDTTGLDFLEVENTGRGVVAARRWLTRLIAQVDARLVQDPLIGAVIVRYAVSNAAAWSGVMRRHADRTWCIEVNSLAYHQYRSLPMPIRRAMLRFETGTLREAQLVSVVSAPLREDICASRPALCKRIVVVPNGGPIRSQPQLPLPDADRGGSAAGTPARFTYLGVFQPYYEFDLVVRAFREMRRAGVPAELHFHGYGPGYEPLRAECSAEEGVHFHGPYDLARLVHDGVLGDATVLLLPNRPAGMSEIGSPIKLYEYMTLGRPIIAADVGQARTVLQHDKTALLYRAGSVESCRDAMTRLALDPALRAAIARSAWDDFLRHHTWAARMRALLDALERVSGGHDAR
jgi:glycosyltransferase involved in cell wall biosynthesis